MEYDVLPTEYWERQDYLLYAYDIVGDMLRQADKNNLVSFSINLKDETQAKAFNTSNDIFDWLDKNSYHEHSLKIFKSHMFFSLLKDFCYYIFESISCAERGKVTVSYTLLRKPIRDNLLYLEWLLAYPEDFYNKFMKGEINDFDISNYNVFSRKKIRDIVTKASQKTYMGEHINIDDLVYTFRFNGKDKIGLQRIWNQSIHLVTRSPNYKTEKGNLNFIFADKEIWMDYWNYYYLVMPQIMAYVVEICETLFIEFTEVNEFELLLNRTIRFSKFAFINKKIKAFEGFEKHPHVILDLLDKMVASFKCECCNEQIVITHEVIDSMIQNWSISCPHCGQEHNICKYYTDIEFEEKI